MKVFTKEHDMQKWLEENLDKNDGDFCSMIDNIDYLSTAKTNNKGEAKVIDAFKKCLECQYSLTILTKDVNISFDPKVSLKPDFLCYSDENQSFSFIELKALRGATREAGTELSAYSAGLKAYIPFLCDGDVNNIIISQDWPTLLTHSIFHEIYWNNKIVLCLEPVKTSSAVKLRILDPSRISKSENLHKFSAKHFIGHQICLYDPKRGLNGTYGDHMNEYLNLMKCGIAAMANQGEKLNGSGFAILWKDNLNISQAPYSISLVNIAAMYSIERFYHVHKKLPGKIGEKLGGILREGAISNGCGPSLGYIEDAGKEFFSKFSDPRIEGLADWDGQKWIMNDRSELIYFQSWGVIRDLYFQFITDKIESGATNIVHDSPDLGMEFLNSIIDKDYEFMACWEFN